MGPVRAQNTGGNPSEGTELPMITVNKILKYASVHWEITLGKAHQKYIEGSIHIDNLGQGEVMLFVDNDCVVLILEVDIE